MILKIVYTVLVVNIIQFSCVLAVPVHNGMMFYRAPPRYTRSGPYPYHQAMLLHYGQPYRRNVQLSANEVAAFAAGDSIGTGSYLQNGPGPNDLVSIQQEPVHQQNDRNSLAVAEAYPESGPEMEQSPTFSDDVPLKNDIFPQPDSSSAILNNMEPSHDQQPQIENENVDKPNYPIQQIPVSVAHDVEQPVNNVRPSVVPTKKKKTQVQLDEDDDDDDDDFIPLKGQKPGSGNGGQYPWPMNSFFPLNFGNTSGGAIAVANSFSTGKGGAATSHATAYGSSRRQKTKKRLTED